MNKWSRRDFLRILGIASGGVLATSCMAAAPETGGTTAGEAPAGGQVPAGDKVVVDWWPGWPGPYMEEIGKLFEEQHPEVSLKIYTQYPDMAAVLAAIAGGTPPDLVADVPYLELIVRGVCLPLDDMISASSVVAIDDGDIRKDHWEVFAWEGQHYGVPAVDTGGRQGMGYNLRLIEEAGLDPENLPRSWNEVFAWHQEITTYDDAGNLQILGMNPMAERTDATSYGDPWMWPEMWGFHYFNVDEKVFEVDREETVDFLNTIKQFFDDVGAEKMEGMTTALESLPRGPFSNGTSAMRITYPSGPAGVWQDNPDDTYKFTYVPMPDNRRDITMQTLSGHAYIVMREGKQPELSFQLAEFMTGKEACDILFDQVGWLGPRKSWQQSVDMSKYPPEVQENIKYFYTSLDEADEIWFEKDPIEGITSTEWTNAWQGVAFGSITPTEAATTMQSKLTEELAAVLTS
jgi:multiple sugar transport system substrate-binding protein